MAWTTPRTWVAGETVTAALMNTHVRDNENALYSPTLFKAHQTTAQSIPNAAFTAIAFDTMDVDDAGGWSSGANTRYTAQVTGYYAAVAVGAFAPNATGIRFMEFAKNGSDLSPDVRLNTTVGGWATHIHYCDVVQLNATDYLEVKVYQNSGGALNTDANSSAVRMYLIHG